MTLNTILDALATGQPVTLTSGEVARQMNRDGDILVNSTLYTWEGFIRWIRA